MPSLVVRSLDCPADAVGISYELLARGEQAFVDGNLPKVSAFVDLVLAHLRLALERSHASGQRRRVVVEVLP